MKKINPGLLVEMNAHPSGDFEVIIVLKEGCNAESLELDKMNSLMENIISVKLNASKISELAKDDSIISIEKDEEMSI